MAAEQCDELAPLQLIDVRRCHSEGPQHTRGRSPSQDLCSAGFQSGLRPLWVQNRLLPHRSVEIRFTPVIRHWWTVVHLFRLVSLLLAGEQFWRSFSHTSLSIE